MNLKNPRSKPLKPAPLANNRSQPTAPPVYRPKATPAVQRKASLVGVAQPFDQPKRPTAPPAYRPQPTPKVLQTKRSPTAPPQFRPGQPGIAQPKIATLTRWRPGSVVQRMEEEKPVHFSDDEDEDKGSNINVSGKYPVIKGDDPWNDEKAMMNHCITYCGGGEKLTWVKFAYVVGAPPPELGHGSELVKQVKGNKTKGKGGGKQGSAKDEKRWQSFQQAMVKIINSNFSGTKGKTPYQKAEKIVRDFDGNKPSWWL